MMQYCTAAHIVSLLVSLRRCGLLQANCVGLKRPLEGVGRIIPEVKMRIKLLLSRLKRIISWALDLPVRIARSGICRRRLAEFGFYRKFYLRKVLV